MSPARRLSRRDPDPRPEWTLQSASAYHCDEWRLGSAGAAMDPSRLCAVCPAAEEVAVASANHAAPDGQDAGDPTVGRYVLHTLSRGVCHQRAKRGCPHAIPELSAVSSQICRQSTDLAAADRPL